MPANRLKKKRRATLARQERLAHHIKQTLQGGERSRQQETSLANTCKNKAGMSAARIQSADAIFRDNWEGGGEPMFTDRSAKPGRKKRSATHSRS